MKIVHSIFSMYTGGAQILVVDLINKQCLHHSVSLIVVNNEVNESIIAKLNPGVSVYYINRKQGSKSPYHLLKLNKLLRKLKPDIVHCHELNMGNFFIFRKFKCILTVHDVKKEINNFDKYDRVVAISRSVGTDLEERYNRKIPVINNGIELANFKSRAKYEFSDGDQFKMIQVSRLMHSKKGQDILIHAVNKLIKNDLYKNIQLSFAGDGESYGYLKDLTHALGLTNNVVFLGDKDRAWIVENLADYHLLVQPSRYEGFGLTLLEGVAAGLPVVASNIEGPAEIFDNCDFKFLFESDNADDCAGKILKIIKLYTSLKIEQITNNTHAAVSKTYSLDSMTNSYLILYEEVINNRQ